MMNPTGPTYVGSTTTAPQPSKRPAATVKPRPVALAASGSVPCSAEPSPTVPPHAPAASQGIDTVTGVAPSASSRGASPEMDRILMQSLGGVGAHHNGSSSVATFPVAAPRPARFQPVNMHGGPSTVAAAPLSSAFSIPPPSSPSGAATTVPSVNEHLQDRLRHLMGEIAQVMELIKTTPHDVAASHASTSALAASGGGASSAHAEGSSPDWAEHVAAGMGYSLPLPPSREQPAVGEQQAHAYAARGFEAGKQISPQSDIDSAPTSSAAAPQIGTGRRRIGASVVVTTSVLSASDASNTGAPSRSYHGDPNSGPHNSRGPENVLGAAAHSISQVRKQPFSSQPQSSFVPSSHQQALSRLPMGPATTTAARQVGPYSDSTNTAYSSQQGIGSTAIAGADATVIVVVVEFKVNRFKKYQSPFFVSPGTYVLVEGDRGYDCGLAVHCVARRADGSIQRCEALDETLEVLRLNPASGSVVRMATPQEVTLLHGELAEVEGLTLSRCRELVHEMQLPMRVIECEYQFDRKKITFYFESDEAVDFRELARVLYKEYNSRIWLENVNVNVKNVVPEGALSQAHKMMFIERGMPPPRSTFAPPTASTSRGAPYYAPPSAAGGRPPLDETAEVPASLMTHPSQSFEYSSAEAHHYDESDEATRTTPTSEETAPRNQGGRGRRQRVQSNTSSATQQQADHAAYELESRSSSNAAESAHTTSAYQLRGGRGASGQKEAPLRPSVSRGGGHRGYRLH